MTDRYSRVFQEQTNFSVSFRFQKPQQTCHCVEGFKARFFCQSLCRNLARDSFFRFFFWRRQFNTSSRGVDASQRTDGNGIPNPMRVKRKFHSVNPWDTESLHPPTPWLLEIMEIPINSNFKQQMFYLFIWALAWTHLGQKGADHVGGKHAKWPHDDENNNWGRSVRTPSMWYRHRWNWRYTGGQ